MSYEKARKAIATYIDTNYSGTVPIFSENQSEKQPSGPFARFSLRPIDAESMHVGATVAFGRRVNGLLWFQFFGVEGQGNSAAMVFADEITLMFDEAMFNDEDAKPIIFRRVELVYVGVEPSGRPAWRITVRFRYDR